MKKLKENLPKLFYLYMTVHIMYDKMIHLSILYKLLKNQKCDIDLVVNVFKSREVSGISKFPLIALSRS